MWSREKKWGEGKQENFEGKGVGAKRKNGKKVVSDKTVIVWCTPPKCIGAIQMHWCHQCQNTHTWFCQELWRDHTCCANTQEKLIRNKRTLKKSCKKRKKIVAFNGHWTASTMLLNSLTISKNSDNNKKPRCLWLMRVQVQVWYPKVFGVRFQ